MSKADIKEWNTPVGGVPFGELIHGYFSDSQFVLTMPPVDGASESVGRILKTAKVIVVTARPQVILDLTQRWVHERIHPELEVFRAAEGNKYSSSASILIDDYLGNVEEFAQRGGAAVIFDQPWNQDRSHLLGGRYHARLAVAATWIEAEKAVSRLSGQIA